MKFEVKFYARRRGDTITRGVIAENKESAIECIKHYYGSYDEDIIDVKESEEY